MPRRVTTCVFNPYAMAEISVDEMIHVEKIGHTGLDNRQDAIGE